MYTSDIKNIAQINERGEKNKTKEKLKKSRRQRQATPAIVYACVLYVRIFVNRCTERITDVKKFSDVNIRELFELFSFVVCFRLVGVHKRTSST